MGWPFFLSGFSERSERRGLKQAGHQRALVKASCSSLLWHNARLAESRNAVDFDDVGRLTWNHHHVHAGHATQAQGFVDAQCGGLQVGRVAFVSEAGVISWLWPSYFAA